MKLIAIAMLLAQAACATNSAHFRSDLPAAKAERLGPICKDCLDA